jgi:hypothetical protein
VTTVHGEQLHGEVFCYKNPILILSFFILKSRGEYFGV